MIGILPLAATRQQFLQELDEILDLPSDTLKGPELLADLANWNSLAVMSFIALADEASGASPAGKEITACKTVDDLLSLAGVRD
jgi:hypothetical protein